MTEATTQAAGAEPANPVQPSRAAFAFIFVTVLLDMIALGIVVPVLPMLIKEFLNGNTADAAHIVGYFASAWALMQFLFQPIIGSLSDRFGRRPVVILSNLGLGFDYFLMALAPNLWFLFAGRLVSGITSASVSTAGAYIADVTARRAKRAALFGMLGAAFGLGFTIGPAVGGWLGEIGLRVPFWGAGALSLINGVYGFFVLPESLPHSRRAPFSWRGANMVGSWRLLTSTPKLTHLSLGAFMQRFAHGSLPSMFVLYAVYRFNWSPWAVGTALAAVGILQTIVSGGLIRPAIKHLGERGTLLLGLVSGIAGVCDLCQRAELGDLFIVLSTDRALRGWRTRRSKSLSTQADRPDAARCKLQGAQSSVGSLADMIRPIACSRNCSRRRWRPAARCTSPARHIIWRPCSSLGL